MEVSKGPVEELWRDADVISLQENIGLYGQLIPGAPIVSSNPQDKPEAVRPFPEGKPVQSAADWFAFDGSSNSIQLGGG